MENSTHDVNSNVKVGKDGGPRIRVSRTPYTVQEFREHYEKAPTPPLPLGARVKQRLGKCFTCDKKKVKKTLLNVFPCVNIMRKYDVKNDLLNDIISGLTVGVMQLPQGMAYAMLADLPPVVGLYMSFFPVLIYFLFGTSRQVSMGTVAVVSLMTGAIVAKEGEVWRQSRLAAAAAASATFTTEVPTTAATTTTTMMTTHMWTDNSTMRSATTTAAPTDDELIAYKIQIGATVAFVTGLSQIGLGLCRAGFVTTYMGDSLVSGFTTGAAVHVGTSQVKYALGLKIPRFENTFSIVNTYGAIFKNLDKTNIAELIITLICIVIIYVIKVILTPKLKAKCRVPIPIELIVVVCGTLASSYGDFRGKWHIRTVGKIPAGLPEPAMPSFANVSNYGFDSVVIGIVAFAQSVSLAVLLAKKYHYPLDANKEFIGYGAGTLFGSFFSCYPMAASVSRSSVQDSAGGRTQLASVFSAGLVVIVILFIGPLFEELPNCCLSAIILVALRSMFLQVLELKPMWRISKYDCAVWIVTFGAVVILSVDLGLYIGIVFAFFTVVVRSQMASIKTVENLADNDLYKLADLYDKTEGKPGIKVVTYNTPLYYANGELFLKKMYKATGATPEALRKALNRIQKETVAKSTEDIVVPDILSGEVAIVIEMNPVKGPTDLPTDEVQKISNGDVHACVPNGNTHPNNTHPNNTHTSPNNTEACPNGTQSLPNDTHPSNTPNGDAHSHSVEGEQPQSLPHNGDMHAHDIPAPAEGEPLPEKVRRFSNISFIVDHSHDPVPNGRSQSVPNGEPHPPSAFLASLNGHHKVVTNDHVHDHTDPRPFRHLVIDCTAMAFVDPQGIKAMKQLIDEYKGVGITTYLGGIRDEVWKTMFEEGFTKKYGSNVYLTVYDAVEVAKEAVLETVKRNIIATRFGNTSNANEDPNATAKTALLKQQGAGVAV